MFELTDQQRAVLDILSTVGPLKVDGSILSKGNTTILTPNRDVHTRVLNPVECTELAKLVCAFLNGEIRKNDLDIKPANVLHVCDIYDNQISAETLKLLRSVAPTYRDTLMGEHLYDSETISEMIAEDDDSPESGSEQSRKELKQLYTMLHDHDAGYLRICQI